MKKITLLLVLFSLFLGSCTNKKYSIIERNNSKIIVGEFPEQSLRSDDFKWYMEGYAKYSIEDKESFEVIKSKADKFDVIVFVGTWCPDSREHFPKFMRIMDEAKVSKNRIKLIGLDRDKKLKGLADRYDIERVPTFIFIVNGKEIGRIVENPRGTLIKDIAKILEKIE